ncbi:DNA alkylation repair protein [Curtobacterium sp. MCBD17_035]|uniref:DNA alkylation repair protein n=1 Tax=Curtobacterium sp. MCBD17_035 TaxID=2175673 RepID=UPI0015E8B9F8|nr:DNA alkylation repair protein [Curtobacterium sp. MCBD17_035]WIB67238.1 DNA alkylation repair protein [Curtobacterium sp. MCBD17_035]
MAVDTAEDVLGALSRTPGDLAAARRVARRFATLGDGEVGALLWSEVEDARLVAVLLLVQRFRDGDDATRSAVVEDYMAAAHSERVDSDLLVEVSAEHIVGAWLADRPRGPLFALAKSDVVWERCIAVTATLAFVKRGEAATALDIVGRLVRERNEHVRRAVALVLRGVGKWASHDELVAFLESNASGMDRALLSAATEHLPAAVQARFRR